MSDAPHEPGRADLPVGQDARQRVPTHFMVPMGDSELVTVTHSASGTARRKPTAPFYGRRFQNPAGRAGNGLLHYLRWVASSKRRRWPQQIADSADPIQHARPPPGE